MAAQRLKRGGAASHPPPGPRCWHCSPPRRACGSACGNGTRASSAARTVRASRAAPSARWSLDATPPDALPLFQRVSVTGELDGAHQFLLDNRSYRGRPGYEVLTPLARAA